MRAATILIAFCWLTASGCTDNPRLQNSGGNVEAPKPSSEPEPNSPEEIQSVNIEKARQLESEIEELKQSVEDELAHRVEEKRASLGTPGVLTSPKPLYGLNRSKLVQIRENCSPKPSPVFNLDIRRTGESAKLTLVTSSGLSACDTLIREILLEARWPECDDQLVPCQFNYTISYPRH